MSSTPNLLTHMLQVAAAGAPELALLAAIVKVAVEDARHDPDARQWLAGADCLVLLGWLSPAHVAPEHIQQRIIARLPALRPRQTEMHLDDDDDPLAPAGAA